MRQSLLGRGLLAVLLPGVLAAVLIAFSFTASLRTLNDPSSSWTGHAYQMLAQQIAMLIVQRQDPSLRQSEDISDAEQIAMIRSSFLNAEQEYKELARIERFGPARLTRVQALFERGVRTNDLPALLAALREANALNAQMRSHLQQVRSDVYDQTRRLQFVLAIVGAFATVALAMLVARFVNLWRAERGARAQQAKLSRELSLMASHELRRPLQQLALVSDLLQHDHLIGEAERARLFQRLQDSAAQLALLSDLSRLEAVYAEPELTRAPHDLAALLAPFARPRVHLDLEPDLVWSVDAARFSQAVENVLENALKYSPAEVRVELRRGECGPEVHVVDRGPGVPPQDRERVFEPFYRAPGTSASGHGLGLAIARRFLRAHGGDITLRDEGNGTRVVLSLAAPPPPRATERVRRGLRVGKTGNVTSRG